MLIGTGQLGSAMGDVLVDFVYWLVVYKNVITNLTSVIFYKPRN